jgi:chitodextrinase
VNLTWTASTDNVGVTGYKIFRGGTQVATSATTSFSDAGLTPGTTYTYTVSAFDAASNESAQSAPASATTPAPDTQAPTTPTNLTATATSPSAVNLTWTASTDNVGVTGYKIFRNGTQVATSSTTSFSDTGLTAATTYTYTVSAFDAAQNNSAQSAPATATTQAIPVSVAVAPTSATLQPGQTQQFTATVSGSANTAVTWTATGGTISTSGLYTAGSTTGSFSVTATSVADTTKSASAGVQITTATTSLPPIPRQIDGPYIVIQSPVSGMHFAAPGTIRIYADPYDPNANDPDTVTVTYLLNGQSVGTFTGTDDRNGYFPFTVTNLAAGTYSITTQITTGGHTVTSAPVTVFVDTPVASSGPVFNLTGDVVLSGSQSQTYAGTASNHCSINGNGFQIRSAAGFTGTLNISFCDLHNLGTATNPGINVTTGGTGSIQLIGNVWETFGTVSVAANDTAQLVVRNNEFRENTLVPATNLPIIYSNETLPVVVLSGNSSTQKFFQGNNVGLSTVLFQTTQNWLIGGNTDADSNILIGVRCGITVRDSTSIVVRGNYSQHNYPHRMSQGDNFELEGDGFLVEHNIIRDSSWPVRGMGGELRYNVIDSSATLDQVIQGPMSNTNMHHNVITYTVSQAFFAPGSGVRVMFNVDNVQFNNNTMDGSGPFMGFSGAPLRVFSDSFVGSLRNNVFYNFAGLANEPVLAGDQGESTNPALVRLRYADYNDFYNPDAPNQTNYGLGVVGKTPGTAGYGQHDLGGFNGHANPKFSAPTALPFPFAPQDVWNRLKKVSDILSTYRAMYTPATGSPLINAGDPQDGNPNIGAVGNGEAVDQFGKFGAATPQARGQ